MKKIRLALLSLSSFMLLFFTACQKDEMDKGGNGTGIQDAQVKILKNVEISDSIEFDQDTLYINK